MSARRAAGGTAAWFLVAVTLSGTLSGCSTTHEQAVLSTADQFYGALGAGDGAKACALLAPSTRSELEQSSGEPCDRGVLKEGVPRPGARLDLQVFGTMAQVRFARDTVFLTRFNDGWRIMATACKPVPDAPYDCQVKGA